MKYKGLDWLKGIAAFFIVGCHITLSPRTGAAEWMTHFCNMFVGVFGAISGFLLAVSLEKCRGVKTDILKKCRRLLPIYVFWTAFYVLVSLALGILDHNPDKIARLKDSHYWISVIFQGGASCHLWYIISLVYASVVVILLNAALPKLTQKGWVMLGWGGVLVYASTCFGKAHWALYDLRLFGFVVTGVGVYALKSKFRVEVEERIKAHFVLLIVALAGHALLNSVVPGFVRDWFVVVPLLFLATSNIKHQRSVRGLDFLASTSLGIYLLHPIFAAVACMLIKRFFSQPFGLIPVLLCWVGVWGISAAVASLLSKVKYFKNLL